MSTPEFPKPVAMGGRLRFVRHELENYKRQLIGLPERPLDEKAPIELVTAEQAAKEFGFGRRTLGRRVAATKAA